MIIFDTESDNLAYDATKIWIFSWTEDGKDIHSTADRDEAVDVLEKHEAIGCHNLIRHDWPLMKRVWGYNYSGLKVDTLALSWYLDPNRSSHGLEAWGEELGFPKVQVEKEEWGDGNWELMKARCERDVQINWLLWKKLERWLEEMYK